MPPTVQPELSERPSPYTVSEEAPSTSTRSGTTSDTDDETPYEYEAWPTQEDCGDTPGPARTGTLAEGMCAGAAHSKEVEPTNDAETGPTLPKEHAKASEPENPEPDTTTRVPPLGTPADGDTEDTEEASRNESGAEANDPVSADTSKRSSDGPAAWGPTSHTARAEDTTRASADAGSPPERTQRLPGAKPWPTAITREPPEERPDGGDTADTSDGPNNETNRSEA